MSRFVDERTTNSAVKDGPIRFNDLVRQLGGASKKMVTQRLNEMEAMGMVKCTVISDKPIAVTYKITDFGRSTLGILDELRRWSEEHNI